MNRLSIPNPGRVTPGTEGPGYSRGRRGAAFSLNASGTPDATQAARTFSSGRERPFGLSKPSASTLGIASLLLPSLALAQEAEATGSFWADVTFYILALLILVAGVMVVASRNPLHGALSLVVSFFCLGGIYVLLFAHLLAALQVLVYAGAIMVLFTFVIMLLNLSERELGAPRAIAFKGIVLAIFAFLMIGSFIAVQGGLSSILLPSGDVGAAAFLAPPASSPASAPAAGALPADYGTVAGIGTSLYTDYLLPFELTSVLLLVAIVGAVAIAKKRI